MEKLLSPEDVCELIPGMTKNLLATMRFRGDGPPFIKPTPRKVAYPEGPLGDWLTSRMRTQTGQEVA